MALLDFFKRNKTPANSNPLFLNTNFSNNFDLFNSADSSSFAAIDIIANSIAGLNFGFYLKDTKEKIEDYPLYNLLNNPNAEDTKFIFFYSMVKDYYESGNIFIYKYFMDNEIVSLFRWNPNKVKITRNSFNQKEYHYQGKIYDNSNVLHIPSKFGFDGTEGYSIYDVCKGVFNNTKKLDYFVEQSFSNIIDKKIVIDISKEFPQATEEQISLLRNKFLQNYMGISQLGKPLIKSGKLEYSTIDTSPKDSRSLQLHENRVFQSQEISKLFGIPLPLLEGKETNNIESLYMIFLENAIRPLASQLEQHINKIIPFEDRNKVYFEFSYQNFLKVSLSTRVDTYSKQLMNAILCPNEIRRKENLPEIEGEVGNTFFVPLNLLPLKDEILESYMASAKVKIQELNTDSPGGIKGNHSHIGDDKGM